MTSETMEWMSRFEALRDDLATGNLCHIQKWAQNDGALTEIAEGIARLARELDAAKEREKEYRHVLILLTSDEEAGIASTEYGEHCVYCFRESADLDPALIHEDDCPVKAGRRALAAGLE